MGGGQHCSSVYVAFRTFLSNLASDILFTAIGAWVGDGFGVTGVEIMLDEQRRIFDVELHFVTP